MTWVLIHSPLLGPAMWRNLVDVATRRGVECVVPDITPIARTTGFGWEDFVDHVVSTVGPDRPDLTIVGHSGAGAMLPGIGAELGRRLQRTVFVDAVIPPRSGAHQTPPDLLELLDQKVENGLLLNWFDWWPEDTIVDLVGDQAVAAGLRAEAPRLARSFYDDAIPVPPGWSAWPNAYVRLSNAYDAEAKEARKRGWEVVEVDSSHLGMLSEPDLVFAAIHAVAPHAP